MSPDHGNADFPGADQQAGPADYARACIESAVRGTAPPAAPSGMPFTARAACFVSIKKQGDLRGCIGTLAPTEPDLGHEIAHNAYSAAHKDPRFAPVAESELDALTYSVDVLGMPQPCDLDDLDPSRYGVIVTADWRRGVLLPGLPGIEDVVKQVGIALQKAGIMPAEPFDLERFTVRRYHEGDTRGEAVGRGEG
jgi:AmmeMemoRadiSam system protein A